MNSFCIIGLGSFGTNLLKILDKNSHEVLGIDIDPEKVDDLAEGMIETRCLDATDEKALAAVRPQDYDCCVVCFENAVENTITVTQLLSELGAKKIIVRAGSERMRRVYLKLGADMVIFPEKDMSEKLAYRLSQKSVFSFFNLGPNFSIAEVKVPQRWEGKSLSEIDVRRRFGVNIVAVAEGDGEYEMLSDPSYRFRAGDKVLVIGTDRDMQKLN